jgi:hypothetical protein
MKTEIKPIAPALEDAPPMRLGPLCPTDQEWRSFTNLFTIRRKITLYAAWWRLELWSKAVRQNLKDN